MSRKYLQAYYLDAKDGRPANEAPLRHGPVAPSDNLEITVVDRRESPAVILGSIPSSEALAPGMTLIKKEEHDRRVAEVESWKIENEMQTLQKRREAMKLSRFQALAILRQYGKRDTAEQIIADPETDPLTVDAWNYATEFRRLSPTILSMAPALGLSDEQLDQMFEEGAEIEA